MLTAGSREVGLNEGQRRSLGNFSEIWAEIVEPISPFVADVGRSVSDQARGFEPEIEEFARYALENQGKRLRTVLLGVSARMLGPLTEPHVRVATIIELIHLATLAHDDVMDDASVRRGRPTISAKWGNEVAVLLGDCLFAHALEMASMFPTTDVCRIVSRATRDVCSGEILQNLGNRELDFGRERYFTIIEKKTAELFATACELGAFVSGATRAESRALRDFGFEFGVAYQLYDDCVDLFGAEAEAGKSLRTDYHKRKITLPAIVAFERAEAEGRNRLRLAFENPSEPGWTALQRELDRSNSREDCLGNIRSKVTLAHEALDREGLASATDGLGRLSHFLAERATGLLEPKGAS